MTSLTPYDTGDRLEPKLWTSGINAAAPADEYGRVDFENDEGSTQFALHFERYNDHGYRLMIESLCGAPLLVSVDDGSLLVEHRGKPWVPHLVATAVERMGETLTETVHADPHALNELTCRELESVAEVLAAGGLASQANALRYAHATGDDDPDDQHHDFPEPE